MLNTEYLTRCIETLEKSYACIETAQEGSIDYEMYRNSLVKSFEITLEQSGKLLRKCLAPYYASKKIVDGFAFKDLFREAHKHSLLTEEEVNKIIPYCVTIPKKYNKEECEKGNIDINNLPSIDYSKLVPYLIKMVQNQEERITSLESK